MSTFFNEYFGVTADQVDEYGAFNVSIINDLPLFIDPFLLFNSNKLEYRLLHDEILKYIVFLRDAVAEGRVTDDLMKAWFYFPEIKQNWLGFSRKGNSGSGLGKDFAESLKGNLKTIFKDFGRETITSGSHIEKVCLVGKGIGRDMISDFTTNLVRHFLCKYTEDFAVAHIDEIKRKKIWINNVRFNYESQNWERGRYDLPWLGADYVLLTPSDILTRDENWINRTDLIRHFDEIPVAIPDAVLRSQVSNYFASILKHRPYKPPTQQERDEAVIRTLASFPQLVDYYIKLKKTPATLQLALALKR